MKKDLDTRGKQCPIPVVEAMKALAKMNGSGILEVHVDNDVAVQNLNRMAEQKNITISSEEKDENHYIVRLTLDGAVSAVAEEDIVCAIPANNNKVVAIGSSTMGRGDDTLGKTLMKGYIYALSQLQTLPKTIIFYNSGAYLTVDGSDSLEDLKVMEAQGVEIFTCGTCLNFYGLTEKLAVGSITNMYSIVEILDNAEKVIKP